jgi:fibronectin type 3 domain-containing protein
LTRLFLPLASLTLIAAIASSAPVAADTRTAAPSAAPAAAPENVGVEPGNAKVKITWSPVAGAEGYRIYQGVNGVWISTPVGRTTGTSHTSQGLANGTMYSFTVAAYTKAGNGPLSLAVSAMPLAPPDAVTATAGDRRVTLSWLPASGATSYVIDRRIGNDGEFTELTTGVVAPPFVDPQLTNGARHQYRISAVTAATQSEWSAIVSAVPLPPTPASAPVVSAVAGNGKVTLTWNAVPGAPGYSIYRSTTGAFTGPAIASTTETTFKSTGLANDTTYFYTVAATNMGGEGPRAAVVIAMPVAPPLPPQSVAAVAGDKQITLSWTPSDGAVAYNVYRATMANRHDSQQVAAALSGAKFVDTRVSNGPTYVYAVTASNAGGESARSIEVKAGRNAPGAMTAESLAVFDFCDAPLPPAARTPGKMQRLWRTLKPF